jgi:hypothetical protein
MQYFAEGILAQGVEAAFEAGVKKILMNTFRATVTNGRRWMFRERPVNSAMKLDLRNQQDRKHHDAPLLAGATPGQLAA